MSAGLSGLVPRAAAAAAAVLVLGLAAPAAAQDPPPPPPPTDTVPARPDTVPTTPAPDTIPAVEVEADAEEEAEAEPVPPRVFPRLGAGSPVAGWGAGVWVWDREALMASTAATLTDLLSTIPGIRPIRTGIYALPETVSAFGGGGGRLEVVLDGYALDPLVDSSPDLSRFELAQLDRVEVRRGVGVTRVEIETIAPADPRSYTVIEAGTGDLGTNLFRGLFLAPRVLGGPLGLAVDRVSSDGLQRREPAHTFAGWAKWAMVRDGTGVQVELRQTSFERAAASPAPGKGGRRDLIVRARHRLAPGLTAEVYGGRTTIDHEQPDTLEDAVTQAGIRAAYHGEALWVRSGFRHRGHDGLPGTELELDGGVRLGRHGFVGGDYSRTGWATGLTGTHYELRGELGPVLGLRLVAGLASGRRGVPFFTDSVGVPLFTDRTARRLGVEFSRGRLHVGAAALTIETDSVAAFGLPFDSPVRFFPGGRVEGYEVSARVPLLWEPLSLEGGYNAWTAGAPWVYMPGRVARVALAYHHVPLASRNLEIIGRFEAVHRGDMRVPADPDPWAIMPAYTSLDLHLQIRILDVRAFLRWENLLAAPDNADLPGRALPGPRSLYGIKWQFWN